MTEKKNKGLTLIEVLVALAIIGIAMTAIIKAVSENIRGTAYLENKTIAMLVGREVMNEARLGLISFSGGDNNKEEETEMLGRKWYWQAEESETPNARIMKLEVKVFAKKVEGNESPLVSLESYVYHGE